MKKRVISVLFILLIIGLAGFAISAGETKTIADKDGIIKINGNEYNVKAGSEFIAIKNELTEGTNFIVGNAGGKFILKGYEYNLPEKTSVLFKDGKVKITLPDGTAVEEPKLVDKESAKNAVFEIKAEKGSLIFGKNKDSFDGTLTQETDKDGKLHSYAVDEKFSLGGLEINQKKGEKTELFSDGEMHPEAKEAYLSLGDKSLVIGKNSEGKGPEIRFNQGNRILDKITEEKHVVMSAGRDADEKNKAEAGTIKITNRGDIVPEVATDKSFRIENGERTIRKGVDKEGSEAILVGSNDNTKGKKSYGMDITNSILQIEDQKYKYTVDGNNQIKIAKIEEAPNKLETNIKEEQDKKEKENEVKPDAVPEDKPPVSINLGEEGKDTGGGNTLQVESQLKIEKLLRPGETAEQASQNKKSVLNDLREALAIANKNGHPNSYEDNDPTNSAHEYAHGVSYEIISSFNEKYGAFYLLNRDYAVLKSPGVSLEEVKGYVPNVNGLIYGDFKGKPSSYDIYQQYYNNQPLHLLNELNSYIIGGQAAIETGSRAGEYIPESAALAMAVGAATEQKDPNYWNSPNGEQFKEFSARRIEDAREVYIKQSIRGYIDQQSINQAAQNAANSFSSQFDPRLRDFARRTYGEAWTQRVFGF